MLILLTKVDSDCFAIVYHFRAGDQPVSNPRGHNRAGFLPFMRAGSRGVRSGRNTATGPAGSAAEAQHRNIRPRGLLPADVAVSPRAGPRPSGSPRDPASPPPIPSGQRAEPPPGRSSGPYLRPRDRCGSHSCAGPPALRRRPRGRGRSARPSAAPPPSRPRAPPRRTTPRRPARTDRAPAARPWRAPSPPAGGGSWGSCT